VAGAGAGVQRGSSRWAATNAHAGHRARLQWAQVRERQRKCL